MRSRRVSDTRSTENIEKGGGHYITWNPVAGAVSYDILQDDVRRKIGSATGTTYTDRSESYSAYAVP